MDGDALRPVGPADLGGTGGAIGAVSVPRSNRTGRTGDAIGVVPVPDPDRVGAVERFSSSLESDGGLLRASTPDASGSANELSSSVGVSSSSHINERE